MPIGYRRDGAGGAPAPPPLDIYDTYPDYLEWPYAPPPGSGPPPPSQSNVAPSYDYNYDRVAPEGYVINDDGTMSPEPRPWPFPPGMSMEPGPPPPDLIRGGSAWQEPSSSAPPAGQYASEADELGFEPFSMDTYASAPLGNNAYYRSYYDALRQQAVARALAQSQRR